MCSGALLFSAAVGGQSRTLSIAGLASALVPPLVLGTAAATAAASLLSGGLPCGQWPLAYLKRTTLGVRCAATMRGGSQGHHARGWQPRL
jgi:hypothetical protein